MTLNNLPELKLCTAVAELSCCVCVKDNGHEDEQHVCHCGVTWG